MFLKRISIQGFKSFAHPVNIEFHKGITCIVGPNGSGKSNISDALRWVLGEQSPRTLRGSKMDEIIFAGSDNSKSRGMAEVTLVIDNECGDLPIDYADVAITRRLYRSGESEYLINNTPCRLRDIKNIIMDTGIGIDGYSIIGQGQIADIVSNKPEERREIFEEAAGIVKYKTKKEDAERKIETSSQNLERINDIIAEVDNSRRKLEKDSEKALQYIELYSEYKQAQINVTIDLIEKAELQNEYVKDDISEALYNMKIHNDNKAELEKKLMSFKEQSRELETKDTEIRDEYIKMTSEAGRINSRLEICSEKISSLEARKESYFNEIELLTKKLEKEKTNLDTLISDDSGMEDKLTKIESELQKRQTDFDTQLEQLKTSFDYNSEKSKLERLEIEEKKISNTVEVMKAEISHSKSRVEILDSLESSYEGYNYAVKFLFQRKTDGIEGVVADLISVPEGYETAIGVALGAQLQNVVCTDDIAAKNAIKELKENNAGRLTFLPVGSIKPYRENESENLRTSLSMPGIIGRASECVKTESRYKNIAEYLLGRVIIADKLENAVRVSKKLYGGYRFVTLEGELINNSGAITGGSIKKGKSGILERKAEITKIEKYLEKLNESFSKKIDEWDRLRKEVSLLKVEIDNYEKNYLEKKQSLSSEHEKELMQLRLQSGNIVAEKNNLDRMASHYKANISDIENDISFKQESMRRLESEADRFKTEAGELNETVIENERILREKNFDIQAIKDMREKLASEIATMEEEKNKADKEVYHYQTLKYELEMKEEKNSLQIDSLKNKLWDEFEISYAQALEMKEEDVSVQECQKKARQLKSKIKSLGEVNLSSVKEYKEVSDRFEFLTVQRDDLNASIASLSAIIKDLDDEIRKNFIETFNEINENFKKVFSDLFEGGTSELYLHDEQSPLESGIDIKAQPPGKKLQNINLMSGGEKTLTAIALMLAVLKTKPTPFCVLDEIEAALDDSNADLFSKYISDFSEIQFILITHKKVTMMHANVLYGITMPERGVSKVFSLKLSDKLPMVLDS